MKDIVLDTVFKKMQYGFSWFMFVFSGLVVWVIVLFLYIYGKTTKDNIERKKGILNLTYQKFIYVYGIFAGLLVLAVLVISFIELF